MTWIEITETEYIEALEAMPPALRLDFGFLLDQHAIHKDGPPLFPQDGRAGHQDCYAAPIRTRSTATGARHASTSNANGGPSRLGGRFHRERRSQALAFVGGGTSSA